MGTNLLRLIKEYKGKNLEDGKSLSGKGRLAISRIDDIQSFYGHAIRNNKGNVKKISKEIWAILHHYSSTIEKPMHSNCPTVSLSWCSYEREISNGANSYKHAKYLVADSIAKVVTPIFKRLADEAFLEGCKNVSNQNANESFNNVLWSFCPKEQFNSPLTTSLAISLAICVYNSGLQYTFTNLLKKRSLTTSHWINGIKWIRREL